GVIRIRIQCSRLSSRAVGEGSAEEQISPCGRDDSCSMRLDANPYEAFAAEAATGNETATAPKPASRTWSRTQKSALPPVRQGDGKTTGRPREAGAPHRGAPRSEPEARALVVAALVHAHVVEVIAPLRVATLVLAGQVGALHVERDVGRDVVADRRIQVAHRLVPDGELVAPGRGVGLAKALAAPV